MTTGGGRSGSLWETLRRGASSEEEAALTFLFPARNFHERLQMLTETPPRAVTPHAVLDVFRKMYKSKVLLNFSESHHIIQIGRERKGRLEGSEISVGIQRARRDEDND